MREKWQTGENGRPNRRAALPAVWFWSSSVNEDHNLGDPVVLVSSFFFSSSTPFFTFNHFACTISLLTLFFHLHSPRPTHDLQTMDQHQQHNQHISDDHNPNLAQTGPYGYYPAEHDSSYSLAYNHQMHHQHSYPLQHPATHPRGCTSSRFLLASASC